MPTVERENAAREYRRGLEEAANIVAASLGERLIELRPCADDEESYIRGALDATSMLHALIHVRIAALKEEKVPRDG
jgi:hypothetical protein